MLQNSSAYYDQTDFEQQDTHTFKFHYNWKEKKLEFQIFRDLKKPVFFSVLCLARKGNFEKSFQLIKKQGNVIRVLITAARLRNA